MRRSQMRSAVPRACRRRRPACPACRSRRGLRCQAESSKLGLGPRRRRGARTCSATSCGSSSLVGTSVVSTGGGPYSRRAAAAMRSRSIFTTLAVVGHEAVDFDLDVGRLRVDGGRQALADQRPHRVEQVDVGVGQLRLRRRRRRSPSLLRPARCGPATGMPRPPNSPSTTTRSSSTGRMPGPG